VLVYVAVLPLRLLLLLSPAVIAACSFDPAGFSDGGATGNADARATIDVQEGPDAAVFDVTEIDVAQGPDAAQVDAGTPDARTPDARTPDARTPDARVPDAMEPVDAGTPDAFEGCPGPTTSLSLNGNFVSGVTTGTSNFKPTCAGGTDTTGGEKFYTVDVVNPAGADLVVELIEDSHDGILEVMDVCTNASSEGCEDLAGDGDGEVVVIQNVTAGRKYIVVDGFSGANGGHMIRAWLRPVISAGTSCNHPVETNRCSGTLACVDSDNNGSSVCEAAPIVAENETIASCVTSGTAQKDDFVFTGSLSSNADEDVAYIQAKGSGLARARLLSPTGGCDQDVALEVVGDNLGNTECTQRAADDNSALGACPAVTFVLTSGTNYWIRVFDPATYLSAGTYRLVVELDYD
jgi:hypothetical protein